MRLWDSFKNILSSIGGRYLLWRDGNKFNMCNHPNEQSLREQIREGFDNCVCHAVKDHVETQEDPIFCGMLVQGAIGAYYQSLKEEETLSTLASIIGVDYDKMIEEECLRALNKYLKQ